jgi:hypothetical protein
VEQDHRFTNRLVKLGMGFFSFETAWRTLQGYEAMNMLREGQIDMWQRKRRQYEAGGIHRQLVWSGYLS